MGVTSNNFLCTVFPVFCCFPMYPIFFSPNGSRIRDPRIELSLFPIFGAERSLIAPFSVTSSIPLFVCLRTTEFSKLWPFSIFPPFPGRTDLANPHLRKKSVSNPPFSWRLLPPVSRKFGTQDFLLNVWRNPRCDFLFCEKLIIY